MIRQLIRGFFQRKVIPHVLRNRKKYIGVGLLSTFLFSEMSEENDGCDVFNNVNESPSPIHNTVLQKLKIKNLVFSGGGPKGIGYVGALEALGGDSLHKIERVAGTSVGALVASLISVGHTPETLLEVLNKNNMKNFIWDPNLNRINVIMNFFKNGYLSDGEILRRMVDEEISKMVAKIETGDAGNSKNYRNLTFGRLRKLRERKPKRYKELNIICGIKKPDQREFHEESCSTTNDAHEHIIIASAVRVSASLPFVFSSTPLEYLEPTTGQVRPWSEARGIDGGIFNNYPINCFDINQYLSTANFDQLPSASIKNLETLGFAFREPIKLRRYQVWTRNIKALILAYRDKIPLIGGYVLEQSRQEKAKEDSEDFRSVILPTCGFQTTSFNKSPDEMQKLRFASRDAVSKYFNSKKAYQYLENQGKEEQSRKNKFEKMLTDLRSYPNSNLAHNPPSDDYIKSHHVEELDKKVKEENDSCILISGIGGIGKSSLIVGYAYNDYLEKTILMNWKKGVLYDAASVTKPKIWILNRSSNDENAYLTSFLDLYNKLSNKNKTGFSLADKDAIEEVFSELEKKISWLIVFDDCSDFKQIQPFLIKKDGFMHGKIIVTSRNSTILDGAQTHQKFPITAFNEQDCLALVQSVMKKMQKIHPGTKGFNPGDPEPIIRASSNIPLYLKIAVARVYGYQIPSYTQYLANINEYDKQPLSETDLALGITKTQKAIVLDSINAIKTHTVIGEIDGNHAYKVLQLCSHVGARDIPDELMKEYLEILKKNNVTSVQDTIRIISKTSLMWQTHYDENISSQLYEMHPISQQYIRESVVDDTMMLDLIASVVNKTPSFNLRNRIGLIRHRYYGTYHLPIILGHFEERLKKDSDFVRNWNLVGGSYQALGYLKFSLEAYKRTEAIAKTHCGETDFDMIKCRHNILGAYLELRQLNEAEPYAIMLESLLASGKKLNVKAHLENLERLLKSGKQLNVSAHMEDLLKGGKKLRLESLYEDIIRGHLNNTLGRYYRDRWNNVGDYHKSIKFFEESLSFRLCYYNATNQSKEGELLIATSKNNIAMTMLEFGFPQNDDTSRKLIGDHVEDCYKVREKHKEGMDEAFSLNSYARFYLSYNDLKNAREKAETSIAKYNGLAQNTGNQSNVDHAHALVTLADICLAEFKIDNHKKTILDEALLNLQTAYSIFSEVVNGNIDRLDVLTKQGNVYFEQNDLKKACEAYELACTIAKNLEHPYKANLLMSLALMAEKIGDLSATENYGRRAENSFSRFYGPNHEKTLKMRRVFKMMPPPAFVPPVLLSCLAKLPDSVGSTGVPCIIQKEESKSSLSR